MQELLKKEPLGEIYATNAIYLPLLITARAATTTTVDYFPADGRVWYLGKVRIVTSANTTCIQKTRCWDGEALNQIYEQQGVAEDKYYWIKDDFGAPERCVQKQFIFENAATVDEDQSICLYGFEGMKKVPSSNPPKSPLELSATPEEQIAGEVAYFLTPVIEVTKVYDMIGMPPEEKFPGVALSFKTCKHYDKGPTMCILNPDYTQGILKIKADPAVLDLIKADPECTEITEADADLKVEKEWYPGYMFDPKKFLLRKLPATFGFAVTTLRDVITLELISYDGLPHLVELPGKFKFYICVTVG